MESLIVVLPLALLVDLAWVMLYLHDRRLIRYLRARHPAVLQDLRGRPRRWYDASDELLLQQRAVRVTLRQRLHPLVDSDPELAAVLADVAGGERFLRYVAWLGAGLSVAMVLLLLVRSTR